MIQRANEEETVGLTDMVLDAEPDAPPPPEKTREEPRHPASDGADDRQDLPLEGK